MRRRALVGSIAVLCAAAALAADAQPDVATPTAVVPAAGLSELLGFVDATLVRVDPATLRPLPRPSIAAGSGGCAPSQGGTACWTSPPWAASPSGTHLALAQNDASVLQLVNVNPLRRLGRISWGADGGRVAALTWLTPRRIVAIQETSAERQRLVVFDLAKHKVVLRRPLNGRVAHLRRVGRAVVLLLTPAKTIGVSRVAVVDPRGGLRTTRIARIPAGAKLLGTGSAHAVDSRLPGLAVDPEAMRAFVVGPDLVAVVDLQARTVSYHSPERPRSLASRLWSWLEPAAHAKQVNGYHRDARWLGGDLLAIAGSDVERGPYRAAGLRLVDTKTWQIRTVDSGATAFRIADELLVATGGTWDEAAQRARGIGVSAYGLDGTKRFQVLEGTQAWIATVYDGRAYAGIAGDSGPLRIVDLSIGQVVGTRDQEIPALLLGSDSSSAG